MKRIFSVLPVAADCGGSASAPLAAAMTRTSNMTTVKMKEVLDHIGAQKGKVVVVDLWGFFCIPCKEEFPNLVRLHHTYGSKGLVCMSLSIDFNDDLKKKAINFLQEKKAVFNELLSRGRHRRGAKALEV